VADAVIKAAFGIHLGCPTAPLDFGG